METFNPDLYKDKVAVITGGTSGLGNGVAIKLASLGAKVYATGINSKETDVPNGLNIEPVELDVTDETAVRAFFDELDQLDILFSGAGITGKNERDLETFEKVVKIHLTGTFLFNELARPLLKKSDIGSIVNVSSMTAIFGLAGFPAYSSSKGAIDQLTKTNAADFAKDGIRVNAVAPGWFKTGIAEFTDEVLQSIEKRTPQKRLGEVEELANVVAFLSSPAASHITGAIVPVDGGYSITSETL